MDDTPVKLLLAWDIKDNQDTDYYEFVINKLIPEMRKMGLADLEFWYTAYGDARQIQASTTASNSDLMERIIRSDEWDDLRAELEEYVEDIVQKVVKSTRGFQI